MSSGFKVLELTTEDFTGFSFDSWDWQVFLQGSQLFCCLCASVVNLLPQ